MAKDHPADIEDAADPLTHDAQADEPEFNPELGTLMGDMRDAMLMRIRTLQKPWAQMTEAEQTDCANGVELAARDLIRATVRLLNKHQWPHAVVELAEMKIGGTKGIEAKIVCGNISHNRDTLGDHVGQQVMIVMVDSDAFMAERAPAQIDKDQPELAIPPAETDDSGED